MASPPLRPEIQDYVRVCEYVLSTAATPGHPPFSEYEQHLLTHYSGELSRLVDQDAQGSTPTSPDESSHSPRHDETPKPQGEIPRTLGTVSETVSEIIHPLSRPSPMSRSTTFKSG